MKKKKEKSSILMHSDLVRMAQLFPPKNESEHIKKNVAAATKKVENKTDYNEKSTEKVKNIPVEVLKAEETMSLNDSKIGYYMSQFDRQAKEDKGLQN
jgi:hypothetical protein